MGEDLRPEAERWLARWDCRPDGAPIVTDDAFLWPVRQGGLPLMLKIVDPVGDEVGTAAILSALDGRGAVRLIAASGPALLMERVAPTGPSLAEMALSGQDEAAMEILVRLALEVQDGLAEARMAGAELPDLIPFDRRLRTLDPRARAQRADAATERTLARLADLGRELAGPGTGWIALHGDMHHFNALRDAARGWLMIDPKGLCGPRAYDFANMILNPLPHSALVMRPERMERMAELVAAGLGIDRAEMLAWVAVQAGLGLAWSLEDDERPYWQAGLELAARLGGIALPD